MPEHTAETTRSASDRHVVIAVQTSEIACHSHCHNKNRAATMSGGYAIVDVDEDDTNNGLQFKTFLNDSADDGAGPSSFSDVGPSSSSTQRRTAPSSMFNLAYYQVYFDVDTTTVLKRVGMAMIPRGGFLTDACEGQVDLYGELVRDGSRANGQDRSGRS